MLNENGKLLLKDKLQTHLMNISGSLLNHWESEISDLGLNDSNQLLYLSMKNIQVYK